MLEAIRRAHGRWVMSRRTQVLANILGGVLPRHGRVLDVGAGDARIDALIMESRSGLTIEGVDVLVRPETCIPVSRYDGTTLPYADRSFDWVLFVDTLHHAGNPGALLAEGNRVARSGMVIKDHVCDGMLDHVLLGLMDWVGNRPHGVPIRYRYLDEATWREIFRGLGLCVEIWEGRIPLYPWPAGMVFNRSLHFITKVVKVQEGSSGFRRPTPASIDMKGSNG
ncbi:MAG: class I SAM-dependent methyltransferase [Deltaproteobacteria bacterium]|nr:class I SAM-dependent methyltransferase [Deltaproteobacteria bacterium]